MLSSSLPCSWFTYTRPLVCFSSRFAGASHHYWTHKVKDTDGPRIVDARRRIHETVSGWLGVTSREGSAGFDGRASGLVSLETA